MLTGNCKKLRKKKKQTLSLTSLQTKIEQNATKRIQNQKKSKFLKPDSISNFFHLWDCDYCFKKNTQMAKHMITKHGGTKGFQ